MAKDINIKVKTEGVDQAAQQIGGVTESIQQMTAAQRESFEASQLAEERSTGLTDSLEKMGDATIQAGQDQREFADYLNKSAQDAQDFQNYLDQAKDSAEKLGGSAQTAGAATEAAMERPAEKANGLAGILTRVGHQAMRMVGGFIGIQGVIKLISALNEQLDQMIEKQKKLTEKSLTSAEGGQALEAATGTTGKQDFWTRQILSLQKAGGLDSEGTASALMLGMQGATKDIGGIQNPAVAAMLQRLAPKLGASNKSASDLSAIFEAASKEGVAPTGLESFISGKLGVSDTQAAAYMQSSLGKSRSSAAGQAYKSQIDSMDYRDWQRRTAEAQEELDRRTAHGENRILVKDKNEVMGIAFESLTQDLIKARDNATGSERDRLDEEIRRVGSLASGTGNLSFQFDPLAQQSYYKRGMAGEQTARGGIINDYSRNTYQMPIVGSEHFKRGARVDPNDI